MKDVEIKQAAIILSCILDDCEVKKAQMTNCKGRELTMKQCYALDCQICESELFGGTATKCTLTKCELDETRLVDCVQVQCTVTGMTGSSSDDDETGSSSESSSSSSSSSENDDDDKTVKKK